MAQLGKRAAIVFQAASNASENIEAA